MILRFFWFLAVLNLCLIFQVQKGYSLSEEAQFKSFYYEIGVGYTPWLDYPEKMQDLLKSYQWESPSGKWAGMLGIMTPIGEEKWLLGINMHLLYSHFTQKFDSENTLELMVCSAFFTSRYFVIGAVNDGFYLADKIGFSLTQLDSSGENSTGWVPGLSLSGEAGYVLPLSSALSLSLNLGFYWNGIGATTEDGYPLSTYSLSLWTGLIF